MLVIQHNCRKTYAVTIAALETGIELGVGLVCLQEPYIDRVFSHPGYLMYWPEGAREDCRVAVAVRKGQGPGLRVEARSDLANHPYIMVLDMAEGPRTTRVVNCYDNWVGEGRVWQGPSPQRRRAIQDGDWARIIQGRCLLLGDFNAHSPRWNPHIGPRVNAGPLEAIIDEHDLIINNDPDTLTRPRGTPGVSIIDLALTTPRLGLVGWEVYTDKATGSDHEVIGVYWEDQGEQTLGTQTTQTGQERPTRLG